MSRYQRNVLLHNIIRCGKAENLPDRCLQEDLTNIRTELLVLKIDVPGEQMQLVAQLEKLVSETLRRNSACWITCSARCTLAS